LFGSLPFPPAMALSTPVHPRGGQSASLAEDMTISPLNVSLSRPSPEDAVPPKQQHTPPPTSKSTPPHEQHQHKDDKIEEEEEMDVEEEEEEEEDAMLSSSSSSSPSDSEDDSQPLGPPIEPGTLVNVAPRTWPGINKPGGTGKIIRRNEDGTYDVSLVLGGSDRHVEAKYVTRQNLDLAPQRKPKSREFFADYVQVCLAFSSFFCARKNLYGWVCVLTQDTPRLLFHRATRLRANGSAKFKSKGFERRPK